MARLIIPEDFTGQVALLSAVTAQNIELGADSPLTAYLSEQQINLDADATAGENAQTHENSRFILSKQSENYRQLRDNRFDVPWKHLTGSVQFLKAFYKGNTKQLGDWGVPITVSGKISYPAGFNERAIIYNAFMKKNGSFAPDPSPLQPFINQQKTDVEKDAGFVKEAVEDDAQFSDSAKKAEYETEQRNSLWQPVLQHLKDIGNFLMKLNAGNEKALGAWGYVVDNSAQKPKLRKSTLGLAEKKTVNAVIIGSVLTNAGTGDIHLYRRKSTAGNPIIIHAGEQFGIVKGYSVITVVNPSTLIEAKFTVLCSK